MSDKSRRVYFEFIHHSQLTIFHLQFICKNNLVGLPCVDLSNVRPTTRLKLSSIAHVAFG
jgi:hypothetical protein